MPGMDLQRPPVFTNKIEELLAWSHALWDWLEKNSNLILGKTSYGGSDAGLWAGDDSGSFKVDIGNDTHYFRFNGSVISFNSTNASLSEDGVLTITNVVATDGNIGNFHLDSVEGLWSGEGPDRVQLKPDGGIWAGAEFPEDAPFYVDINGTSVLNATNITIGKTGFLRTKGKDNFDSLVDGIWAGYDNGYYKVRVGSLLKYIEWDGVEMTVRGKLNASDIETGTLHADRIEAGTIVTNHVADDNITRSFSSYTAVTVIVGADTTLRSITLTPVDTPLIISGYCNVKVYNVDAGDYGIVTTKLLNGATLLCSTQTGYSGGMDCNGANLVCLSIPIEYTLDSPGTSEITIYLTASEGVGNDGGTAIICKGEEQHLSIIERRK